MFGLLGTLFKSFFSSAFAYLRTWQSDRKRDAAAEVRAENKRLKENIKLREELAEEDKKRKKSENIDTALDRWDFSDDD